MTFNLYDANGNHIGNVYTKTDYLGGGKVWKFRTNSFKLNNYQFFEVPISSQPDFFSGLKKSVHRWLSSMCIQVRFYFFTARGIH